MNESDEQPKKDLPELGSVEESQPREIDLARQEGSKHPSLNRGLRARVAEKVQKGLLRAIPGNLRTKNRESHLKLVEDSDEEAGES